MLSHLAVHDVFVGWDCLMLILTIFYMVMCGQDIGQVNRSHEYVCACMCICVLCGVKMMDETGLSNSNVRSDLCI